MPQENERLAASTGAEGGRRGAGASGETAWSEWARSAMVKFTTLLYGNCRRPQTPAEPHWPSVTA